MRDGADAEGANFEIFNMAFNRMFLLWLSL
jgi:hypothetical protein